MKNENVGSKYTESWLPIKSIMNGMIQTEDGYYVTGVKVAPKNIFILEENQENSIIFNFRNFYNMIDYEFWLLVADRPVDISSYLSRLQTEYNNTNNPVIRKMIMQDIDKANQFMGPQFNVVDTEYFILFKDKKIDVVQKKISQLIGGLAQCSLNSSQVSNEDLRVLINNFFNGGQNSQLGMVIGS